jgi:hypothetical protein
MSVKQLNNGKRMDGVYTPTLALNTESVATFITTCYLKKASKSDKQTQDFPFFGV